MPEFQTVDATSDDARASRAAGVVLIASTLLGVAVMAHHPTTSASGLAQSFDQMQRLARLSAWVHGILIALMLGSFYGLTELAYQRGLRRSLVRIGLITYATGTVAMVGAALISGFVTTQVAGFATSTSGADIETTGQLIKLCWLLNQAMAKLGVIAMSAGILAWSFDLLRSGKLVRLTGAVGVLVGMASVAALMIGVLSLNVHGMMLVVVTQAIWTVMIGILLFNAKLG